MSARSQPNPYRKPFFGRRFLWLLIFILIPVIALLNNLGPSEAFLVDPVEGEVRTEFEVAQLSVRQDEFAGLPVTWVDLPDSGQVRVSVLSNRQPLEAAPAPGDTHLEVTARHGLMVSTLTMPLTTGALQDGTRFLSQWLPANTAQTRLVVTGDLTPERVEEIASRVASADAPGAALQVSRPAAVTRLVSPRPGTEGYLHFALAMELLGERLDGYNARLIWSHRTRDSEALLNTTLDSSQRRVPGEQDFLTLREDWVDAHTEQRRSVDYIHGQLVTLTAYDVTPDHLTERTERLAELDYETFRRLWEQWFERS